MVNQSRLLLICTEFIPLLANILKNKNEFCKFLWDIIPNELISSLLRYFPCSLHLQKHSWKKKKSLSSGLQIDDLWNFTSCLTLLNSQFFGFLCCLTPYSVFALHLDSLSQSKIQILYSCSYVTLLEVGFIAMVLHIMAVVKLYLSFMPCPLFYKVWSGMMYHWHS